MDAKELILFIILAIIYGHLLLSITAYFVAGHADKFPDIFKKKNPTPKPIGNLADPKRDDEKMNFNEKLIVAWVLIGLPIVAGVLSFKTTKYLSKKM